MPLGAAGAVATLLALTALAPAAAATAAGTHTAPFSGDRMVGGRGTWSDSRVGCYTWARDPVPTSVNLTTGDVGVWVRAVSQWCGGGAANYSSTFEFATLGFEGWAFKAAGATVNVSSSWTLSFRAHAIISPVNGTGFSQVVVGIETRLLDPITGNWTIAAAPGHAYAGVCYAIAYGGTAYSTAGAIGASYVAGGSFSVTSGRVYVVWTVLEVMVDTSSSGVGDWALGEFNLGGAGFGGALVSVTTP